MNEDIPVSVIAGYLGAGKTTLINNVLRQNNQNGKNKKIAVLVNEFGELSIDEDLIEEKNEKIISIAGGCVCCSYGNNLVEAVMEMKQRNPKPDNLIIEASGVAIPNRIAASVSLIEGVKNDAITVIVDAQNIKKQYENSFVSDTIEKQMNGAHLLVVNKCDEITKPKLEEVKKWVNTKIEKAKIIETNYAKVENNIIFDVADTGVGDNYEKEMENHSVSNPFVSMSFETSATMDEEKLASELAQLPEVIRAKGFVKNEKGEIVCLQIVGGTHKAEIWNKQNKKNALVVLGVKGQLDEKKIREIIRKYQKHE